MKKGGLAIILSAALVGVIAIVGVRATFGEAPAEQAKSGDSPTEQTASMWDLDIRTLVEESKAEIDRIQKNKVVVINGEEVDVTTKEMEKWMLRSYMDAKMVGAEEVSDEALVENALVAKNQRENLLEYASQEFGVEVQPEDVRAFIDSQVEQIEKGEQELKFFKELSSSLGITLNEFYYEWEYDNFAMIYVSGEVFPILQERYGREEQEDGQEYQASLREIFIKGLDEFR
ncbi:hypothetical protein [Thalassobacillus hwangdonensis]|uniref:SurA N-terminal domain-containing protein n=1 Tax=Thalassobacillus hwangdonensis TaxID=546108 RepID=A0ABW3L2C9_9BACI